MHRQKNEYKIHGRKAFFFLQAEDGIRDYKVTGVQTCALPILSVTVNAPSTVRMQVKLSPVATFGMAASRLVPVSKVSATAPVTVCSISPPNSAAAVRDRKSVV